MWLLGTMQLAMGHANTSGRLETRGEQELGGSKEALQS